MNAQTHAMLFGLTHYTLIQNTEGLSHEESLRWPAPGGSVQSGLAGLAFHEAYHAGQVGLLRRLAGKEGRIR